MKFNSHLLLADYLYAYLVKETGIRLDKSKFKYGHVKPDIRRRHYGVKHYYQEAQVIVETLIDRVENEQMDLLKFSETLGVICHFVSDYYCLYHHDIHLYNGSKIKHFRYENQLHKCLKAYLQRPEQVSFEMDAMDMRSIINYTRDQYKKAHGSLFMDAVYAVAVTGDLSKALIKVYDQKTETMVVASAISPQVLVSDAIRLH